MKATRMWLLFLGVAALWGCKSNATRDDTASQTKDSWDVAHAFLPTAPSYQWVCVIRAGQPSNMGKVGEMKSTIEKVLAAGQPAHYLALSGDTFYPRCRKTLPFMAGI